MKPRIKVCKAFARNLAAGVLENLEVCWQEDHYELSSAELDVIGKEIRRIAEKIANTVDFEALKQVKRIV